MGVVAKVGVAFTAQMQVLPVLHAYAHVHSNPVTIYKSSVRARIVSVGIIN